MVFFEKIYTYLLEKRAEASITKASNISDHQIIDEPRLESNLPISPNTSLNYVVCFILGISFPLVLITLYFFLKTIHPFKQSKTSQTHLQQTNIIQKTTHNNNILNHYYF